MPTRPLPDRPNPDRLRRLAKQLQRGARDGDPEALALVAEFVPGADPGDLPLHLAQLALARSFRFPSWPRLVRHLRVVQEFRRDPDTPPTSPEGPVDEFLRLAMLVYSPSDDPERRRRAAEILAEEPDLGRRSIQVAAAFADPELLRAHLLADPSAATTPGGPFGWRPILSLAYSRVPPVDAAAALDVLLDAGADPNDGFLWHGLATPFTVLTGLFGNGEQGEDRQPGHPQALQLARRLLVRGADPNDGQTLYNKMFGTDDAHLRLLFEFGLGAGDGGIWHARMPEQTESPQLMLRRQLSWAVDHGLVNRIELLAQHGVSPAAEFGTGWGTEGVTPLALAVQTGQRDVQEVLRRLGAPAEDVPATAVAADALLNGEAADPAALPELRRRHPSLPIRAVRNGRPDVLAGLLDAGFDLDAKGRADTSLEQPWQTPLHTAVELDDEACTRELLRLGADPDLPDRRYGATPLGWAEFFGRDRLAEILRPVTAVKNIES
jgi:hypothetical protein